MLRRDRVQIDASRVASLGQQRVGVADTEHPGPRRNRVGLDVRAERCLQIGNALDPPDGRWGHAAASAATWLM